MKLNQGNDLKIKTIRGLIWSFAELLGTQGIQFIVIMILARQLSPENFGFIGMLVIFIALSNLIIDSGFTQALIRESYASESDYSTVFFFNLFMSCSLFIILYFFAPIFSSFFKEEQLIPLLRVLSLGLIINSLGIIQRVILIKKIDFKTQTKINLLAATISGFVAIIFALRGYGVWSLVAQTLTLQITQTVLLWTNNKWFPIFFFSIPSFKRLFGFGFKLLISGLIDTIYNNLFSIIIGRLYPAAQLGLYTNAVKLGDMFTISITSAIQRVTYPVLSSIQEDKDRLRYGFQRIIRTSAYIMFPIMSGLIAVSDTLIPVLLGPRWFGSIIYFKLLCIAGMLYPLHAINLNILQVKGKSSIFLKLEIIKKILLTFLIVVSIYFSLGIIGLIGAAIICSYLSLVINAYYSAREIAYSISQQIKDILPIFLFSVFMGSFVYLLGIVLPVSKLIKLFIQISSGSLLYVLVSWIFKIKEFETICQVLFQFLKKAKQRKINSKGA
ncbi:lipopolysaccharide biosynthesis protein [Peribacillus sp. NPDC097206]|uniref:lipopolysaccharide biosynthesis protein n=1 Tax=unclassified Peribacillus TaxID=2675266 RepID=UPI003802C796